MAERVLPPLCFLEGSVWQKMRGYRWLVSLGLVLATCSLVWSQEAFAPPTQRSGQSVTGAFEGWFPNEDGTYSLLVGYFNRDSQDPIDVPIGPNNRIEPGGPDQGQPTHFLTGRAWGVFTIKVPKDFGDKILTWTITANGKTTAVPLNLKPLWRLEPFRDANGNTPPYIGFSNEGPFVNGPVGQNKSLKAKVGTPLPLTVWLADDAVDISFRNPAGPDGKVIKRPEVTVHWMAFRAPGEVKFASTVPPVEKAELDSPPAGTPFNGKSTTTVTFSAPGDYILNVQANDSTSVGGGGNQCCWANAKVMVSVEP